VSKTAVLFPGQGAQAVGMGRDIAESFGAARQVFAQADDILGIPLSRFCFEGPADRLNATDVSQPAIFVTSVAAWRALEETGGAAELAPRAMAGLSLGEYTALHVGGWMPFEDCLRLVAQRGQLMQVASEATESGMVSIIGLSEADTSRFCQELAGDEVLVPANFNCPGQIVVSGHRAACERAVARAESYGAKAVRLTVAGAFHSPLMDSAALGLAPSLAATRFEKGRIPVVSNVSADYYASPEEVRVLLKEQVAKPIRWQASVERLISDGFDRFAEVGPGRVLAGLMRKIDRSVTALNFSTASAMERVSA